MLLTMMLSCSTDMADQAHCDARRDVSMGTTANTPTHGRQSYTSTFQRSSTATNTIKYKPTVIYATT